MRRFWKITLIVIVLLAVIQLVPVERRNPPVTAEITVSPEVHVLLKRACYDCHSHETVWPWYSSVAPISWLVAHDVSEGREHLNFSTWGELPATSRAKRLEKTARAVAEGWMPPWFYLPAHPDARLSDQDKSVLLGWAKKLSGQ